MSTAATPRPGGRVRAGTRKEQPPTTAGQDGDVRCMNPRAVDRAVRMQKPEGAIESLAQTFKVLGDPTRLRIVGALARAELCVCDLATVLGVSQSVVSHSLRALRQLRIVRYRRAGKVAYYSLDDGHIDAVLAEGFRHVGEQS